MADSSWADFPIPRWTATRPARILAGLTSGSCAGVSSAGTDGNMTAPARGNNDFWVVDLNAKGDPLWDQTFGGGGRDVLYSLSGTRDGGLIFGGDTLFSVNGNKTSALIGSTDF